MTNKEQTEFDHLARDFVGWVLESLPTFATFAGVHTYDDRLQDMSSAGLEDFIRQAHRFNAAAEACEAADVSQEIDLALIRSTASSIICTYEKLRAWATQPSLYLREALFGPYLLLIRDSGPPQERARNLAKRLRCVRALLDQAKANLDRPPRIWTDTAIREVEGGMRFLQEQTTPFPESAIGQQLARELVEASETAIEAMREYRRFLEDELLSRSDGDFAAGEGIWNEIAREWHLLDADAAEILLTGKQLVETTRAELESVCKSLAPESSWGELLRRYRDDHPSSHELLDVYKQTVQATRDFVADNGLVTILDGEQLDIQETPSFQRPIVPYAAYVSPGAFEREQRGVFWVTPVDADLTPAQRRAKLRSHARGKIPVVALHEGYPGHHLQLTWSNKVSTSVMKVASLSSLFVEGWAFYCEEMMDRHGFLTDPASRVFRLADQLWRAYRIVIDVGLHCGDLPFGEAVRMLVEEAGLEEPDAQAEARRYTQNPTQPMCYLIGKEEILKLFEEYRRALPGRSLRQTHDAVLTCGSLPPKLLRRKLFENS